MLPMLLTVSPGGIEPTAKLLVNREGGELTDKFLAIGDSRPPIPF